MPFQTDNTMNIKCDANASWDNFIYIRFIYKKSFINKRVNPKGVCPAKHKANEGRINHHMIQMLPSKS